MTDMLRAVLMLAVTASAASAQDAAQPAVPRLTLADQFEKVHDLAELRGGVAVVLYGDRRAVDANRELGAKLFVQFHPSAQGQPPHLAANAPVAPLAGVPAGTPSPEVHVVAVACVGRVPSLVATVIRNQIARGSPVTPVWLDFEEGAAQAFGGVTAGEPNLALIDAAGRLRFRTSGKVDDLNYARLVQAITQLRTEAAAGR